LPVAIFAVCPLQLRYALEARPYEQALCLAIWSTILFLRLWDRPESISRALTYASAVALGAYTQPFTLFVPLAHLLWLIGPGYETNQRRLLVMAGLATLGAVLAFVPWYVYVAAAWRKGVGESQISTALTLRDVPVIWRELMGTGYLGTTIALAGVLLGLCWGFRQRSERWFWLWYLLTPLACAIAADGFFHYFFAIRQVIFILAPISILFALGAEASLARRSIAGLLLAGIFLGAALYEDAHWFRRPRENWRAAADILASRTRAGACAVFSPPDSRALYAFFIPELSLRECRSGDVSSADTVVLALLPNLSPQEYDPSRRPLIDLGFEREADFNPDGPRVELYRRRLPPKPQ
jgi:hypothetical protein